MRKIILMLILTTVSNGVVADWVKVTSNAESGLTVYADPSSMSQSDNKVSMLSLYNFSKARVEDGFDPYLSAIFQVEYNCEKEHRRVLEFTNFSGNMGNGEVLFSYHDIGSWTPFELESLSEYLWKYACKKWQTTNVTQ